MTAQMPEVLIMDGMSHAMHSLPLGRYFADSSRRPALRHPHTACWRGYVGTWEVANDKLYLVGFEGWAADGSKLTLGDIFPDRIGRVLASWFSGKVKIPSGELLQYNHLGFASAYEADIILKFRKGVLLSRRVRDNRRSLFSKFMRYLWGSL